MSTDIVVCHLLIGLSHLVSVSYTEDSYGVVQSSLPGIITVLLDTLEVRLLLSVDSHIIQVTFNSRI